MKLKNLKIYLLAIFGIFLFGLKTHAVIINLDNPKPYPANFFKNENKENIIQQLLLQKQLAPTNKPLLEEINKNIDDYTMSYSQETEKDPITCLPNKLIYTVNFTPSTTFSNSNSNTTLSSLTQPILTVNFNYTICNSTSINLNNTNVNNNLIFIHQLESLILQYSPTFTLPSCRFRENSLSTAGQNQTIPAQPFKLIKNLIISDLFQSNFDYEEKVGFAKKERGLTNKRTHYLLFVYNNTNYYLYDFNININI